MLGVDGTWSGLPYGDSGYSQKVFWWSESFDFRKEPTPQITVTGKRLDAPAPPLKVVGSTNAEVDFGQAMLTGVEIPTSGCWEITGSYKGHELSFIVWVKP